MLINNSITSITMMVEKGIEILYELFSLAIAVMMWNRNKEIQDYWDAWEKFQKIIAEKKHENFKTNKLVSLWLSLSDLTNHFNEAHSFVFLSFFAIQFFNFVTSSYAVLNYSAYKNIYPITLYAIIPLVLIACFLLISCEAANSVNHRSAVKMIQNERNDYIETIRPMLCCLRINGILPMQLIVKNHKSRFLSSKSISALTQSIHLINLVYNLVTLCEMVIHVGENFNMKILIASVPEIFMKITVIVVPLDIWTKSNQLKDYWTAWKEFQDEYERISKTVFDSDKKKTVQKIIFITNLFIFTGEIIIHLYMSYGANYVRIFSDYLNISIVYYLGAYWYINCIYVKSVAKKIISEVKKTMTQDENGSKLHEIISLWITSSDLMEQFYIIHSVLLLVYIMGTIVAMTIFAFICMNSSAYTDIYGVGLQLNGLFVCIFIIFLFCETAHVVYKQVVINQSQALLVENAMKMDPSMLQSISLFLETMFVKNPEISIKGYLTLDRSVFVSILAVCINYLIVLRQFQ